MEPREQLAEIAYDHALGYIKELNRTIRRNKTHSYNLVILSFVILSLIIKEINIQQLYSAPIACRFSLFGFGLFLWFASLFFLFKNVLPSDIDLVYTRPKKLWCEEFLSQDKEAALKGLCKSIDKGIEAMETHNKKLAANNRYSLILLTISFMMMLWYILLFP